MGALLDSPRDFLPSLDEVPDALKTLDSGQARLQELGNRHHYTPALLHVPGLAKRKRLLRRSLTCILHACMQCTMRILCPSDQSACRKTITGHKWVIPCLHPAIDPYLRRLGGLAPLTCLSEAAGISSSKQLSFLCRI